MTIVFKRILPVPRILSLRMALVIIIISMTKITINSSPSLLHLILTQGCTNLGKAILTINLGTIETESFLFKDNTLDVCCRSTTGKRDRYTLFSKGRAQLIPISTFWNGCFQSIINAILHGIGSTKSVTMHMLFAVCQMKVILLGQTPTDLCAPYSVISSPPAFYLS